MTDFLFDFVTFLIAFPVIFFIGFYIIQLFIFRKKSMAAFGIAADVMTIVLFIAVPAVIYAFWSLNIVSYLMIFALLIGIILTFVEWKTRKEVLVMPLLRKIWRTLFLILNIAYIGAFIMGAVQFIWRYMS